MKYILILLLILLSSINAKNFLSLKFGLNSSYTSSIEHISDLENKTHTINRFYVGTGYSLDLAKQLFIETGSYYTMTGFRATITDETTQTKLNKGLNEGVVGLNLNLCPHLTKKSLRLHLITGVFLNYFISDIEFFDKDNLADLNYGLNLGIGFRVAVSKSVAILFETTYHHHLNDLYEAGQSKIGLNEIRFLAGFVW